MFHVKQRKNTVSRGTLQLPAGRRAAGLARRGGGGIGLVVLADSGILFPDALAHIQQQAQQQDAQRHKDPEGPALTAVLLLQLVDLILGIYGGVGPAGSTGFPGGQDHGGVSGNRVLGHFLLAFWAEYVGGLYLDPTSETIHKDPSLFRFLHCTPKERHSKQEICKESAFTPKITGCVFTIQGKPGILGTEKG